MATSQTNTTIKALVDQMKVDAQRIASQTADAGREMEAGNRNGAIGALLASEAEVERISALLRTILTLHRTP